MSMSIVGFIKQKKNKEKFVITKLYTCYTKLSIGES